MFNQLSKETKILASLQSLSASELTLAIANLNKLITLLSVDPTILLSNRRTFGTLLTCQSVTTNHSFEVVALNSLFTDEEKLTTVINTMCLTEAIIVRDTLDNALEVIAGSVVPNKRTPNKDIKIVLTAINTIKTNDKKLSAIQLPLTNVAPIHLADVKQRLTQALQPREKQQVEIRNTLNALLTKSELPQQIKQA